MCFRVLQNKMYNSIPPPLVVPAASPQVPQPTSWGHRLPHLAPARGVSQLLSWDSADDKVIIDVKTLHGVREGNP